MAEIREPESVRREIALERDQLARSLERLREEMLDAKAVSAPARRRSRRCSRSGSWPLRACAP